MGKREALADLLTPPTECAATGALKMRDRRKGALWHCPLARKIIGKGRKRPDCLCSSALLRARKLIGGGDE